MEFATHVGVSKVIETQLWAIDSKMQFLLSCLCAKRYCSTTFFRVAKSCAKQEYDLNKHINLVSLSRRIIFKFIRKT